MMFVRGCIGSQDDNGVWNTTVQFLKPPISMENIGKWCCQSGINCQTHWCIVVRLSDPAEFSYDDQNITVYVTCSNDVPVERETDTNHKAFDWSFWYAKSKHSHQLFRSLISHFLPSLASSTLPRSDYYCYTLQIFVQFTPGFPILMTEGKIPLVFTKPGVVY